MPVRTIRLFSDPALHRLAEPVTVFDDDLRALVRDLVDTVGEPGRVGVAAPQIGVGLRVFSYLHDGVVGHLVNPVLTGHDGTQIDDEACLSLPGLGFATPRAMTVVAHGQDQYGAPSVIAGSGMLARILQHETDHLDGRLYLDVLTGDTRRQALRELRRGRSAR